MNITRYFSLGSESEAEGLTFIKNIYNQDGDLVAGIPNPEKLYNAKEITEEEYLSFVKQTSEQGRKGIFGLVNKTGKAAAQKQKDNDDAIYAEQQGKAQVLIVKRLARQLEAGLIDEEDLDTAIKIELPGVPVDQISVLKDQVNSLRVKHETM